MPADLPLPLGRNEFTRRLDGRDAKLATLKESHTQWSIVTKRLRRYANGAVFK